MTENKRFTSDIHRIFDNDEEIACADTMGDAEILVDRLNEQEERVKKLKDENEQLKKENKHLQCTIESNSQDDYIDFLEKQNKMLKERIEELTSNDKIVFMVNE